MILWRYTDCVIWLVNNTYMMLAALENKLKYQQQNIVTERRKIVN